MANNVGLIFINIIIKKDYCIGGRLRAGQLFRSFP